MVFKTLILIYFLFPQVAVLFTGAFTKMNLARIGVDFLDDNGETGEVEGP